MIMDSTYDFCASGYEINDRRLSLISADTNHNHRVRSEVHTVQICIVMSLCAGYSFHKH